jgi:hypothetical protein
MFCVIMDGRAGMETVFVMFYKGDLYEKQRYKTHTSISVTGNMDGQ